MMRVSAVIDRLKDQLVSIDAPVLRSVAGAGMLPSVPDVLKFTNSAFVIPKQELPGPNIAGTGIVMQQVEKRVSVLIGFVRMNQRKIGDLDSVEDVVEAVKTAMIGWVPTGEQSPVTYAGGGVAYQDFNQGLLIWACDFACPYFVEI